MQTLKFKQMDEPTQNFLLNLAIGDKLNNQNSHTVIKNVDGVITIDTSSEPLKKRLAGIFGSQVVAEQV
jgi:hypothetical protein